MLFLPTFVVVVNVRVSFTCHSRSRFGGETTPTPCAAQACALDPPTPELKLEPARLSAAVLRRMKLADKRGGVPVQQDVLQSVDRSVGVLWTTCSCRYGSRGCFVFLPSRRVCWAVVLGASVCGLCGFSPLSFSSSAPPLPASFPGSPSLIGRFLLPRDVFGPSFLVSGGACLFFCARHQWSDVHVRADVVAGHIRLGVGRARGAMWHTACPPFIAKQRGCYVSRTDIPICLGKRS